IWAGTQQYPHIFLLTKLYKFRYVFIVAGKVKYTRCLLLIVPENIYCYSITPHCFCHLYTLPPILFWYTCRVHLATDDLEGFPIQKKSFFTEHKAVFLLCK